MSYPLAIFSPRVGAVSETFIRRHIENLLPGGTIVLTRSRVNQSHGWTVNVPLLEFDRLRPHLVKRAVGAIRGNQSSTSSHSLSAFKQFVKRHHVEVLLGEYIDESIHWFEPAKKLGLKFFAHAHGYDVSKRLCDPRWRGMYASYNDSNGIITMSQHSRTRLIESGLKPSKVYVVPYGVDVPGCLPTRQASETVRCLIVGRMVGKKSPILALDSFRRAAEANSNLRLDLVGEGSLLPAVHQFIECFNLDSKVTLHTSKPNEEILEMMRRADIYIQHSVTDPIDGDQEGLPLAILEAMAQGLPVVSTQHAGIPEAVLDGATGFLVGEGDSKGMAEYILELARDRELSRSMGQAGWQRAKENFSSEQEQARLSKLLGL